MFLKPPQLLPSSSSSSSSSSYTLLIACLWHLNCRALASFPQDESVTVNGSPQASTSSDVGKMRIRLDDSRKQDYSDGLVQFLHDAARNFELAIKEHSASSKMSWFSTAWLGIDRNAWIKALSYQASVYSLLQAASEISSRGDSRDRDVNVFVERSLLRQSAPLESLIRDQLLAKQPEAYDWFWSQQIPVVTTSFVNNFERDPRFAAATALDGRGLTVDPGNTSDTSLLMLALACLAAITKLGPAKVSCPQFFSIIPEISGRLMDMLVEYVPISEAFQSIKSIGMRREFLVHFGSRAAACRVKNDWGAEEVIFWVDLVQKQLQQAIDRERIWSRLTTSESIEVLEKDLAIFGFFIALGRSTQSFLSANGFDVVDDSLGSFIRYLIGGSVLYYPHLSSISSYQLYVEVVCEELDWLPFYPSNPGYLKPSHGHVSKREGPPNVEAIPQALDVCAHWIECFIKYSKWLENPSNVKAAKFLSVGHTKLMECMEEQGILKNEMLERNTNISVEKTGSSTSTTECETESFDKALESVEEALKRLEQLLQELHVSSTNSGREHLKAACSDLEKIRKLKKEAEFLEASFRAKAAFLQQEDDESLAQSSSSSQHEYLKGKSKKRAKTVINKSNRSRRLWNFLVPSTWQPDPELGLDGSEDIIGRHTSDVGITNTELNEFHRFELLRNELMELEKRVQRSSEESETDEDLKDADDTGSTFRNSENSQLVQIQKKDNIIEKSIDKLKETGTDVWQGTQLLAIDVAAAMGLLRRVLIGDELTGKEKKALRRTLTDLASVVPIGVLMLLPVTAVGHAAMLAAIQRYVPSLIPSTYGQERLNLLRQLEKVKEMKTSEANSDENTEEEEVE
ncbi:LETM1-like protein [Cucumis melo var. makuwa]|uniref:LETM1-like protein n=1 Tax=Cucumis melo var. makuwa TaxID=1194695 RepID=A0A5A7SL94_CUCMM|nr:LETM1-like protein [Cucumis melo var. makuwa]